MTLNELIKKANQVSWILTSGDIPLTMNGQPIEIYDITLEGSNGNYWANLKVINRSPFNIKRLYEVAKPETEQEKAEALAREARRDASLMINEVDPEIADTINKTNILDLL